MMNLLSVIIVSIITGFIGYFVGSIKFFREQRQKAYTELLPNILKVGYHRAAKDEFEFCKALSKLWLYGSRNSAIKMDKAVSIIHDPDPPSRGNLNEAFQEAIIAMRQDIMIFHWLKKLLHLKELKPEEVGHIYSIIRGEENN